LADHVHSSPYLLVACATDRESVASGGCVPVEDGGISVADRACDGYGPRLQSPQPKAPGGQLCSSASLVRSRCSSGTSPSR
jgi:hypothetical protein